VSDGAERADEAESVGAERSDQAESVADGAGRSHTVRLCGRDDLADGEAMRFDVAGLRIALVRIGDRFHAIGDRCSHEDFSLAEGEVWADECEIECAKHGSTFDLLTGEPCSLPATRPVPVYRVTVEGDDVSLVVP
jgi:3-phenylpropionate/trans-cinnamate dioxygenase ferredoxin subunit